MAISVAAIAAISSAGGAFGVIILLIICFGMFHCKRHSNRNSDTASTDPSAVVDAKREGGSGMTLEAAPPPQEFGMKELEEATKQFDECNVIGYGSFGVVYKGLLSDGTVVAVKRRLAAPRQQFAQQVVKLSKVQQRNIVSVIGYCQDCGYQMLVFEYLPNGSMRNHLYQTGSDSRTTKLEFKTRISIATGAAKGLWHLHRQRPMVLHGNFKTGNVLVDENFIAKVSGAGVSTLLQSIPPYVGPSHSSDRPTPFTDPHQYTDTDQSGELCEASDVYSFGVFLWELISGREALHIDGLGSNESMLHWVEKHLNEENLVDGRLTAGSFTVEGMGDFIKLAMRCTSFPRRDRPTMEDVVAELEKILDKEIMGTTFMGDEEPTPTVTLGSQLFTN